MALRETGRLDTPVPSGREIAARDTAVGDSQDAAAPGGAVPHAGRGQHAAGSGRAGCGGGGGVGGGGDLERWV